MVGSAQYTFWTDPDVSCEAGVVLAKVEVPPCEFSRSLRTLTPTLPPQVLLLFQVSGSGCLAQHDRSCPLYPGDWCLIDTGDRFDGSSLGDLSEYQILVLERPCTPDILALLEQGVARRFDSKAGMSRVLRSTLDEAFQQMNRLGGRSGRCLRKVITAMTWDAVREQLDAPAALGVHEIQCARLKRHIEACLADPDLCVESIAEACRTSVRSVHRVFAADAAGSVWKYVWKRRLRHCAAELRDPMQSHRSITDICFAWGFNSTSHFSRLFKEQFGVPPSRYRPASWLESGSANKDDVR
ncbi:helix-turn-helix domain-containing protein [Hyphomicrobium sp. ghe19]|uniref:helix-turn-helix domain-containing protein n=1 Tax=Hyphomicrobium sp. ghe19 TaxID=2682968 RepID=UPI0013673754|nr:Transcriptional activator FeaR [Hyphomicrobium sp. ghe19]